MISSDGSSRVIVSDQEAAQLRYTYRVSDPNLFDELFIDALAWRLATKIGPRLRKPQLLDMAMRSHDRALAYATGIDSNERRSAEPAESSFVTARL